MCAYAAAVRQRRWSTGAVRINIGEILPEAVLWQYGIMMKAQAVRSALFRCRINRVRWDEGRVSSWQRDAGRRKKESGKLYF